MKAVLTRTLSSVLILIGWAWACHVHAQVRPDQFPEETNPTNANFEVYSQKGGVVKRASLFSLKKYFAPDVRLTPIIYIPTLTGNVQNLTEFVIDPFGDIWYIDSGGEAIKFDAAVTGYIENDSLCVVARDTFCIDGVISAGADNWGSDTVNHDITLTGQGTTGDPLKADTTILATKYYADQAGSGVSGLDPDAMTFGRLDGTLEQSDSLVWRDTTLIVGSAPTSVQTPALELRRWHNDVASAPIRTILFWNPGDLVGGSDYQNEVQIGMRAGTTTRHRRYLRFEHPTGSTDHLFGVNAGGALISFDSDNSAHRETWWEGGATNLYSDGSGAFIINEPNAENPGVGGFIVHDGGVTESKLFQSGVTDRDFEIYNNTGIRYAWFDASRSALTIEDGEFDLNNSGSAQDAFITIYRDDTHQSGVRFAQDSGIRWVWNMGSGSSPALRALLYNGSGGFLGTPLSLTTSGQVHFGMYTGSGFSGSSTDSVLVINPSNGAVRWRNASFFGGGGGSVSLGTDNQIPYMNSGGTDFEYSANLVFDHEFTQIQVSDDGAAPLTGGAGLVIDKEDARIYLNDNNNTDRACDIQFQTFGGNWHVGSGFRGGTNDDLNIARDGTGVDIRFRLERDGGEMVLPPYATGQLGTLGALIGVQNTDGKFIRASWHTVRDSLHVSCTRNGSDVFPNSTADSVGIGNTDPTTFLHVSQADDDHITTDMSPGIYLEAISTDVRSILELRGRANGANDVSSMIVFSNHDVDGGATSPTVPHANIKVDRLTGDDEDGRLTINTYKINGTETTHIEAEGINQTTRVYGLVLPQLTTATSTLSFDFEQHVIYHTDAEDIDVGLPDADVWLGMPLYLYSPNATDIDWMPGAGDTVSDNVTDINRLITILAIGPDLWIAQN